MENLSMNQRVLLATVLSLVVFIVYDLFFLPKPKGHQELNATAQSQTFTQKAPEAPKATAPHTITSTTAPSPSPANIDQPLVTIKAQRFDLFIDRLGRISQVVLEEQRYQNEAGEQIRLFNPTKLPKPLEIRFGDPKLNERAFQTPYRYDGPATITLDGNPKTIELVQDLGQERVIKRITIYPDGHYDLQVILAQGHSYYISPGYRPDVRVDGYTLHGALIREADGTVTWIEDGDAKGGERFPGATIAAGFDRYYTTALYNFDGFNVIVDKDEEENPILFIQGAKEFQAGGYVGPKEYERLAAIDPRLTDIIEYGFFTFIAKPMFKALLALYHLVGNWGWAIVLLTIIIRILLFPLTLKGMLSMQKLKELAPKIKEIQERYKGDPQKLNLHMMQLYKKYNVNPMSGCLPLLLQIPIFFAIYRVLLNAIELKGAPWILWIKDLSAPDPYYVLPILMGATMYLHQKLTPTTITDPVQKRIFEWLPVVFTLFFLTFPAGLTLYWFVNNILSIIQQLIVNKIFATRKLQGARDV
ncbi:MAG: membrane protein insertase YidC [Nitratiruptor sp.]|nr:membrane protein insertase YidC [Nitratiruptor sp.]NPA84046.1 membrane protein insertase YidC [Campylobacterota bacterium]